MRQPKKLRELLVSMCSYSNVDETYSEILKLILSEDDIYQIIVDANYVDGANSEVINEHIGKLAKAIHEEILRRLE